MIVKLVKVLFLISVLFSLSGCAAMKERAEQRRASAIAAQKASISKVRKRLNDVSGGQTLSLFEIDSKSAYYQTAFDYVSLLGGTVVSRGKPQFKLAINVDKSYVRSYRTKARKRRPSRSVTVNKFDIKIYLTSVKGIDGGSTVLFYKGDYFNCSGDCTGMANREIKSILYSL